MYKMKPISKKKLLSISNSLKSNTRKFGPRLRKQGVKEVIGGDKKINSDFSKNIIKLFIILRRQNIMNIP